MSRPTSRTDDQQGARRRRRVAVLVAAALIAGAGASPAPAATDPAPPVLTFSGAESEIVGPFALTTGPDGAIWFANNGSSVGRMAPDGTITSFRHVNLSRPNGIVTGADGNLWLTADAALVRLTPDGTFTFFDPPGANPLRHPVLGADGNVWFVNSGNDYVGRITPAGTITTFTGPAVDRPSGITAGPDGAMWFTSEGFYEQSGPNGFPLPDPYWSGSAIGRITSDGVITSFPATGPSAITTGPDGDLWFLHQPEVGGVRQPSVGRMAPDGTVRADRAVPSVADRILTGPGGAVWFTGRDRVHRITEAGLTTVATFGVTDIAVGSDEAIWVAGYDRIRRIAADGSVSERLGTDVRPIGLTLGGDGAIWFPQRGGVGRAGPGMAITNFRHPDVSIAQTPVNAADGSIWFGTERHLVRASTAGALTSFPLPSAVFGVPTGLVAGPDGTIWFPNQERIWRVTGAGAFTSFAGSEIGVSPSGLVAGTDGNIWLSRATAIVRVTPAGVATAWPASVSDAGSLVAGPDGNLWYPYVSGGTRSINRITPTGTITTFTDPAIVAPTLLADGRDGALWFVNQNDSSVGRIRMDGSVTRFPIPAATGRPSRLVPGPDGNLWFTQGSAIGRISPAGEVTRVSIPAEQRYTDAPVGLTAGADGGMWFKGSTSDGIGRVQARSGDQVTFTVRYDAADCATHSRLAASFGFDGPAEVLRRSTSLLLAVLASGQGTVPSAPPSTDGPCALTVTYPAAHVEALTTAAEAAGYTPEELLHTGGDFIVAVIIAILQADA